MNPTVRDGGQDWSSGPKPCERCGAPVLVAHNQSEPSEVALFEFEPAGRGYLLRYKRNDSLPTQAELHEIHVPHSCEDSDD